MAVPETTGSEKKGTGVIDFLRETKVELKKVTWPTKQEIIANTIVVLIAVILCAGLIWIIDTFFSVLFGMLLR
ncbi:MAG: preprotein translocase subunit SecE [Acidaminococcaceae bacterium]|nr:preprotein translocase subunit SecE [Acidaminococcaceae bacterium]